MKDDPFNSQSEKPTDSRMARRRSKKAKQKAKKPKWKRILRVISKTASVLVILVVLATGTVATVVWHKHGDTIKESVTEGYALADNIKKEDFIKRQPTIVYDVNGKKIKELKQFEYDSPSFKEMNPLFTKGIVSVEDKRFYLHHGVDLYGTLRSAASTVLGKDTQGGSTLTQQLVRNVILEDNEVSIERKLKEQVVSQELEKKLTKDEIIENYLNNVYFGHGNYGIGPASKYYFGKNQSELTADEVAVIIGITNNPSLFDPITKPQNALNKRNRILNAMLSEKIINESTYQKLIKKPIKLNVKKHNINNAITKDDALSFAIHKATESLMEKNGFIFQYIFDNDEDRRLYKENYQAEYDKVRERILMGGYEIHTSIDRNVQKQLEQTVQDKFSGYYGKTKDGIYRTQVAMTTVDNKTGDVLAIVGGRNQDGDYLNRAYQGIRQPGSAAKPLVAYANAFEEGYKPQSNVVDSPIKNGPHNWYKGYRGTMTIRYALEQSVNTTAYKLANQVGSDKFMSKLEKMKFSNLTAQDANPIIAIGGFTNGVSTVEMASGYSTFTRDGKFIEPTNVQKIEDVVTKEVIVKNEHEQTKVFKEDAAYFTIDSLKGVITSGTGKAAKIPNYPYAFGKTGTTNGNKDTYFVGGTPYYTTAIWVGHDTPETLSGSELNIPQELFKKWNTTLHVNKKKVDFKKPDSVYRSGKALYSKGNANSQKQATREANEKERLRQEEISQRERLELEDYRIIHHLTKEEEDKREARTEKAIEKAKAFEMTKLEQYPEWTKLIDKAKSLNDKVKHQKAKDRYAEEINQLKVTASIEKENLEREIQRQKEEARRKEEARKQEEAYVKSLENQIDSWMTRLNSGEQLSQDEFEELEALMQKAENKGIQVPNLNVEWIEPETTESKDQAESTQIDTSKEDITSDDKEDSNTAEEEVENQESVKETSEDAETTEEVDTSKKVESTE